LPVTKVILYKNGSSEEKALVERHARELKDQEDRVQSLQHEISDLHKGATPRKRHLPR